MRLTSCSIRSNMKGGLLPDIGPLCTAPLPLGGPLTKPDDLAKVVAPWPKAT